jgi:integrase
VVFVFQGRLAGDVFLLYLWDIDFGPTFIKICAYFPYPIKDWLNGHEWAKRQATQAGIEFSELSNGFARCADPAPLQAICDRLGPGAITVFFERWMSRLPLPLTDADRAAGYSWELSMRQVEVSRTLVFDAPRQARAFFEALVADNLDIGRPDSVELIFHGPRHLGQPIKLGCVPRTRIVTRGTDVTVNAFYKNSRIKQYLKDARALRIETVINSPDDLRCHRRLLHLDELQARARAVNRRLLDTERVGQAASLRVQPLSGSHGPPSPRMAGGPRPYGSATLGSRPWPAPYARQYGDDVRFRRAGRQAAAIVLQHCADTGRSWWGWTPWEWARLCGSSAREFIAAQPLPTEPSVRPFVVALAYLLGGFTDFHRLGTFNRLHLACLIFGEHAIEESLQQASELLDRWGYRDSTGVKHRLRGVFSRALLLNHSPRLDDLDTAAFVALRAHPATDGHQGSMLYALQRVVAALGHCDPPVRTGYNHAPEIDGTDPAWADWIERWHATSTLTPRVRATIRIQMAKTGRWLAAEHPEITEPGQWTRATCAEWVAAVDRLTVGDYVQRREGLAARAGAPIAPRTKQGILTATRVFFRDCQEWEWIPRRFDPNRALAVPRSVAALIGTNPRVIADEVWAKLLWAGLNPAPADLPGNSADTYYPMELICAVTLTWLFSGLRSNEISRLRVGCIRWQHDGLPIPGDSRDILAEDAVCLLDVPVHKTGTAFTKPVDPIVGQAIEAWQALRPEQPKRLDRKTAEHVNMLFSVGAQPVAKEYINHSIIPALCGKAGVPPPTSAARSPATEPDPRSPASSTTPRSR